MAQHSSLSESRLIPTLGMAILAATFAFAMSVRMASAQGLPPSIPATFYGAVLVNGEAPADGTAIIAQINGKDCTQKDNNPGVFRDNGIAVYAITVVHSSQLDGCGTDGAEVTFLIGDQAATQKGTFKAGFVQVGLSIGSQAPPVIPTPLPGSSQATPTDPTAAAATATQRAAFTPLPAPSALPTDDAILPTNAAGTPVAGASGTPGAGASGTPGSTGGENGDDGDDDGGSSALAPVLIAVGVIAVAGAAGGVFYARRRGGTPPPAA